MLADPSFLFKFGTKVVIDSCCATFAEVFELYDPWTDMHATGFMDTAITPSFHSLILHSSLDDIFVIPKE
jgi:hypothetical protein|uniref:Uncharacterized protein n=1 Tax=Oryza barthii TaxID=65489 RepID=A0A0D3HL87_9ORYZ